MRHSLRSLCNEKQHNKVSITCIIALRTLLLPLILLVEMEFKGVVVAHGCTIVAGDEIKLLISKQISAKISIHYKKQPVAFSISLENCSQDIYKSVTITLDGQRIQQCPII